MQFTWTLDVVKTEIVLLLHLGNGSDIRFINQPAILAEVSSSSSTAIPIIELPTHFLDLQLDRNHASHHMRMILSNPTEDGSNITVTL